MMGRLEVIRHHHHQGPEDPQLAVKRLSTKLETVGKNSGAMIQQKRGPPVEYSAKMRRRSSRHDFEERINKEGSISNRQEAFGGKEEKKTTWTLDTKEKRELTKARTLNRVSHLGRKGGPQSKKGEAKKSGEGNRPQWGSAGRSSFFSSERLGSLKKGGTFSSPGELGRKKGSGLSWRSSNINREGEARGWKGRLLGHFGGLNGRMHREFTTG
ncbi:uncharacterized protein J3R85_004629 [Psidium guajava]|nr:uncharacterized protein J3R85_004629 [Psidium guajava]